MAEYDIEGLCDDIETLLKANLNTYITALNTEKGDSPVLDTIDSDAYFFQTMDGKEAAYSPYVFYGVQDIADGDDVYNVPTHVDITVAIIIADEGQDVDSAKRMFRYLRVLKNLFKEKFDSLNNSIKITIKSQVPIELVTLNESRTERAVGVTIGADFA